jgi:hypothetical protein
MLLLNIKLKIRGTIVTPTGFWVVKSDGGERPLRRQDVHVIMLK